MSLKTCEKYKIIDTDEEFNATFVFFPDYVRSDLREMICAVIRNGGFATVSEKTDPKKYTWDGSLAVHFPEPPSAIQVVNLLAKSHSDKFGMEDDKTLWLWWD